MIEIHNIPATILILFYSMPTIFSTGSHITVLVTLPEIGQHTSSGVQVVEEGQREYSPMGISGSWGHYHPGGL